MPELVLIDGIRDTNTNDLNAIVTCINGVWDGSVFVPSRHTVCDDDGHVLHVWSVSIDGRELVEVHVTDASRRVSVSVYVADLDDPVLDALLVVVGVQVEHALADVCEPCDGYTRGKLADVELVDDPVDEVEHEVPVPSACRFNTT